MTVVMSVDTDTTASDNDGCPAYLARGGDITNSSGVAHGGKGTAAIDIMADVAATNFNACALMDTACRAADVTVVVVVNTTTATINIASIDMPRGGSIPNTNDAASYLYIGRIKHMAVFAAAEH